MPDNNAPSITGQGNALPLNADDPKDGSSQPITWYLASLLGLYLLAMSILLSYMLYNLWPPQRSNRNTNTAAQQQSGNRKGNSNNNANTNSNASTLGNTNSNAGAGSANPNSNTTSRTGTNSNANTNSSNAGSGGANSNTTSRGTGGSNESGTDDTTRAANENDPEKAADEVLPTVTLFRGYLVLTHSVEVRLLLIALLAGALGSFIHTATSFADYVGNQKLSGNWVWWYLLRPFIGMTLALVFYFVVRGGFISPSAGGSDMNPFGIAAMAGMVGMFSKQAIDKLNEVFTSMFGSKGDEKRGDKLQAATIAMITPSKGPIAGNTAVKITGSGFLPRARVTFGGKAAGGIVISADGKSIAANTPAGDAAGAVDVEVINENTQKAALSGGFSYE